MINNKKKMGKLLLKMAQSYGNRQPIPEIHYCYFPSNIPRKKAKESYK